MSVMSLDGRWSNLALGALALGALLACKKGSSDSGGGGELPAGPISVQWEQPYKATVAGSKAEATFFMTSDEKDPVLRLRCSFSDFPQGTKVAVGSEQGTTSDSGYANFMVDVKPAVAKASLEDLKDKVDLGLTLSITPPGGAATTTPLQKQDVKGGLRLAFMKARDGGFSFGDADVAAAGKPRGVAVLGAISDVEFIGPARTPLEVDWVVVTTEVAQPRATKSCDYKKGPVSVRQMDATATLYERRTGKKLDEKLMQPSEECPMFVMVDKDNTASARVSNSTVVEWAREKLAAAP